MFEPLDRGDDTNVEKSATIFEDVNCSGNSIEIAEDF